MENSFLPAGEKAPEGNYMKLLEGENSFRALSSVVTGWEYWNKDNKSVRLKTQPLTTPEDIRIEDNGKPSAVKYFWAFVIFSHRAQKVQILEITQVSIQNAIRTLTQNKKWGNPKGSEGYDITITRTGSGLDSEYNTVPNPKEPFPVDLMYTQDVNLEALFTGGDPFAKV